MRSNDMRRFRWIIDAIWLVVLAGYVLAGRDAVPFHGDESTLIAMSRDYHTLVHQHAPLRLAYDPTPADPAAQSHRIVNGTVSPFTIGLAWDLAGYEVGNLNAPWVWGWTLDQNRALGHLPTDGLLHAARTPSALLTALSVWGIFSIAWIAARARPAAYAASLIYATQPAVLINGRRAVMEGPLLVCAALAVLAALWIAQEQARKPIRRRVLIGRTALFAVIGGVAVASKHTAVITVIALIVALVTEPLVRRGGTPPNLRRLARWIGALGVIGLVFLALNPAWWRDPWRMPGRVLHERTALLNGQVDAFGGYDGPGDRIAGWARQLLWAGPQYFEAPGWDATIREEIEQYEASGLGGRGGGPLWGALLATLLIAGAAWLIRRWRESAVWVTLVWAAFVVLSVGVATPIEWQRYYLPAQAPLAVIAGIGAAHLMAAAHRALTRSRHSTDPIPHA